MIMTMLRKKMLRPMRAAPVLTTADVTFCASPGMAAHASAPLFPPQFRLWLQGTRVVPIGALRLRSARRSGIDEELGMDRRRFALTAVSVAVLSGCGGGGSCTVH